MNRACIALFAVLFAANVQAEVKQSAADGFFVVVSEPVVATPAKIYAALAQPEKWWSDEHTWSGKAANLSLTPEAGGCFCERWAGGSAEHGRVIMALPDKLLRLDAALGPLQEFAVKGILSFWIRTDENGSTQLDVEYRVNGASASGLDTIAPSIDAVLAVQVGRLKRYIESGDPTEPPPPPTAAQENADARAAILKAWEQTAIDAKGAKGDAPKKKADPPGH